MKKVFVFLLLFFGLAANAIVIKGGIHYTVETARQEAFSKVKYSIPMDEHKKYLSDPGFSKDKNGKTKIRKFGRFVTFFSDGEYGVFSMRTGFAYFYDKNGKLYALMKKQQLNYPLLVPKYDTNGKLIEVMYKVKPQNTYVYGADKSYKGHWLGDNFYDTNGNLKYKRSTKYFYN